MYRGASATVVMRLGDREVPIISLSQIRRLGEQEGFDAKLFIEGWRKSRG